MLSRIVQSVKNMGTGTRKGGSAKIARAFSYVSPRFNTRPDVNYISMSERYRNNVAVYRCVTFIARNLSGIKWVVTGGSNSDKRGISREDLERLLVTPNFGQSWTEFVEEMVSFLLIHGNSYIEVVKNDSGVPVEFHTLRPDRVAIKQKEVGCDYSYFNGKDWRAISTDVVDSRTHVLHAKLFNPLNDLYGMSPMQAALKSIEFHDLIGRYNVSIIQNGGNPSLALMCEDKDVTDEQIASYRASLEELYAGPDSAGRMGIFCGNFSIKELGIKPKELDFVQGKSMSENEIAQAFGIPAMLVASCSSGHPTYSNYQEARESVWIETILPLLLRFLDLFNGWLCSAGEGSLRFEYDKDSIAWLYQKIMRDGVD